MPISREEFEPGRIDLTLPILRLLTKLPNLAFTADDVHQMLNDSEARGVTLEEVDEALKSLVAQEQIQEREIQGYRWYTVVEKIERRLGFLPE